MNKGDRVRIMSGRYKGKEGAYTGCYHLPRPGRMGGWFRTVRLDDGHIVTVRTVEQVHSA